MVQGERTTDRQNSTPSEGRKPLALSIRAPKSPTVHRCFQKYTSSQRADHAASHRLGFRKREAVGEFFYVSDLVPGFAFPTRKAAQRAERMSS